MQTIKRAACATASLLIIGAFQVSQTNHWRGHDPIQTTVLSADGGTLVGLFDGLKADPVFSIAQITSHQHPQSCHQPAPAPSGVGAFLDRVLGIASVFAQPMCEPNSTCRNNWECATEDYCDLGLCGSQNEVDETYYTPYNCDCYGYYIACDCGANNGAECQNNPQCFNCY